MAIISFTNYKRGQTTGCTSAVMRYTMQDKKTEFEGQQLVTGINCQPESVYADFMTTKRLYHKTDGVLFYHMVQSFPKGESVDPVTAHAAALKLAEYYEGYEVLVCTHTDREHIHSHFLINSVNFDTGRKLHIAKEQLQELRQRNDMVCKEFSLPVFQPREQKQKTKTMTIGEYHTAARGQSKKLQLMNIINDCMRHASNREEFIALMESEGYKVRWEKSRKNITYTTPSGWQCRDRLLFGDKYLKENMEYEFRIREEIIYGRAHGPEPARAFTAADSAGVEFTDHAHCHPVSVAGGSDDADTEDRIHRVGSAWNAGVSSEPEITHRPDSGAEQHGEDPEIVDGDDHSAGTGWEEERKAFLQMAGLASGLRPDRSGQMDRTGTAHRGGTAGDGVWHSDSGQQHPQPVSMKPLHAGLYGLAVTGALLDDGNEDVEECYTKFGTSHSGLNAERPYNWTGDMVADMLQNMVYLGHTVNLRYSTKSYKDKKRCERPKSEWLIFENTHEELVDQETWDIVQEVRSHKRRRTNMDEQNMFSGLVYCADCGKPMVLHRAHTMKPEQNHFTCRTYKKDGAEVCSAHYIREVALKEIVLETIRRATEFARSDPERFAAYIQQKQSTEVAKEIRGVERELSTMRKRDGELDVVFKRMYEDSALGRVSNEQFRLLSEAYSKEKAQLAEAIPATEERLEKLRSSMANAKNFIAKARKFTDMTELTPELLRTFVAKIIVYEKEVKYSKHAPQKIHICFRDFNLNETDDMLLCGETTEKADSTIALPA